MRIDDPSKAAPCLERIGYYRLSGYWFPFRDSVPGADGPLVGDHFRPNTDFGTIVDLYVFDKRLRLLLLDAIERIEIALRVQVVLLLGAYRPLAHRDPNVLHGKFAKRYDPKFGGTRHAEWLRRTDEAFGRSKEEFAKHFRAEYPDDTPPVWIACEAWDFGALSILFGGMKKNDQLQIARKYEVDAFDVMETWVRAINVARNVCAHHGRLWNKPLAIQPRWPKAGAVPALAHLIGDTKAQTRVYGILAILRFMLKSINPTTSWPVRLRALTTTFPEAKPISLAAAGFPDGWEEETLWI